MLFGIVISILIGLSSQYDLRAQTFKAAVYEHNVTLPPSSSFPVSRDVALKNMMVNLEVYKNRAIEAKIQVCIFILFERQVKFRIPEVVTGQFFCH